MTTELEVVQHYRAENITARVLAALRAVYGPDAPITPDLLAPIDHFHGWVWLPRESSGQL
jgi:hypothetical protein